MTETDIPTQDRRRPWVRYEREHSLSTVHMDWSSGIDGITRVCVVLDDASRMVLAGGEFTEQTAAISIELLNEAYDKYLHIAPIREVVTDHGSQFYCRHRKNHGEPDHSFEMFCTEKNIRHILAGENYPRTNGKIERWFSTYRKFRSEFRSFEEYVDWYNKIRPHMSLDWNIMETPEMAFYRKAVDIIRGNCVAMITRGLEEK